MARLAVVFVVVMVGVVFSCVPPDCDHPDCGSCGNACCIVDFEFKAKKIEDIFHEMLASLKAGGDDKRYTFVGQFDLRPYKLPHDPEFALQAIHATKVNHYNDTLYFALQPGHSDMTVVRGFSNSQLVGSYCDSGQNYKNVVGFMKGLHSRFDSMNVAWGCENTSSINY